MHHAFTHASDPRSWKQWFTLGGLVGLFSGILAFVAGAGGHALPAFWVLWAVMAAAGLAALAVRAVAVARHTAAEITAVERALWVTGEVAGVLAVGALILSTLL